MDVEVDKLNAHILANAKSSLRLQDAERREASLKQSLEENLLSYQRDLSSMRHRIRCIYRMQTYAAVCYAHVADVC